MAITTDNFRSEGGFGIGDVEIVTSSYDIKNANSLEIKNSNFLNGSKRDYIARFLSSPATPSGTLSLSAGSASSLILDSSTVNFVTATINAVNTNGSGYYSVKLENSIIVNSAGSVSFSSELRTIIKDSIPSNEAWSVNLSSTAANRFTYNVNQGTSPSNLTWIGHIQIVSTQW